MKPTKFCKQYAACREGKEYAETFATMAEVWDNCQRPEWMFWILARAKPLTKYQSVRLAIAFAETCLQYVPADEQRPALAIQAAKNWLENPCDETKSAAYAAASASNSAATTAAACAAAAALLAGAFAAAAAARVVCQFPGGQRRCAGACAAAWAKNCDIIRSMIPNPFN